MPVVSTDLGQKDLEGRPFDEPTILRIARAYERATDWHTRRPDPATWRLPS